MKNVLVESVSKSDWSALALISVRHADGSSPGQFYMVRTGDFPVVPRPYSVFLEEPKKGLTTFLVKERGLQTSRLLDLKPGDTLQLRGPFGKPFPVLDHPVLVAGGCGFAPLHYYATKYSYSSFFLGTETKEELAFLRLFRNMKTCYGDEMVTDLFLRANVDGPVISCGPSRMLRTLSQADRPAPVYVSLESRMACASGMCLGCPVKTRNGEIKFVCKDGPLFDGREVDWDWLI
ncbi:MAG TPA: hypothetical protein DCE14_08445 [Kosmotogaceae bacterium]|nr:MAG: Dihydroorotate dehydrogenase, electron transfer subunit [Thermotogales bacterium 46_20]HAA86355.1 hypothetical protein [Kosmotogaceae bacterium]